MSDDDEYPTLNDSMGAVIKLVSELTRKRDALKARVAELEAEVERLRVIELPEIGRAYAWCNDLSPTASQLFSLRMFAHDDDGDFIWSPLAHAFVALLNAERKV